jgi:hypothetical protein
MRTLLYRRLGAIVIAQTSAENMPWEIQVRLVTFVGVLSERSRHDVLRLDWDIAQLVCAR